MKILITGANGFVGKNLVETLRTIQEHKKTDTELSIDELYTYDRNSDISDLHYFCQRCNFVFHLAGVNRTDNDKEFITGNRDLTMTLVETLRECGNTCPIMFSSSIQAAQSGIYEGSIYGKSKAEAESILFQYGNETGAKIYIYRFPNLFGKWCKPNYNSAVATFCNALANQLSYQVTDPQRKLELLYIDDLIDEMLGILEDHVHHCDYDGICPIPMKNGLYCYVPCTYTITLGEIVHLLTIFDKQQDTLFLPNLPEDSFEKKLYATYLSYLPSERTIFDLHSLKDDRGAFTEFFKTESGGQFSVNVSKPEVVKGEHWHHSKTEIFMVVSGHALIQERRVGVDENGRRYPTREFRVSGERLQCVRMLPGYTHNIINLSDTENLVTVMWANEVFEKKHPDTFREKVNTAEV